jgi:hypothetical protein
MWSSLLTLSILPAAALSLVWGRLIKTREWLAEFASLALAVGLLVAASGLAGWGWRTGFAIAYLLMEVGTTLTWVCAEAEAVTNATDVRRTSALNGIRYASGVPAGQWSAILGSELTGIWAPAVMLASVALALQLLWSTGREQTGSTEP